eukprot:SAG11_NODE_13897_length_634_cov_1.091589_1_plen_124_part_00
MVKCYWVPFYHRFSQCGTAGASKIATLSLVLNLAKFSKQVSDTPSSWYASTSTGTLNIFDYVNSIPNHSVTCWDVYSTGTAVPVAANVKTGHYPDTGKDVFFFHNKVNIFGLKKIQCTTTRST